MIAELRKKAGLTQRQLAEKTKVTVTTISNWETGVSKPLFNPSRMLILCKTLNCTLEELAIATEKNRT